MNTAIERGRMAINLGDQRTRAWLAERSPREQVLLGALAAIAIIVVLLAGVIAPLRGSRQQALTDIRTAALIEARLKAGGAAGQHAVMRRGTPSAILTDSTAAAGLTMQRIEPEGGNTRVVLDAAPFDKVLGWIADVEATSRLRIVSADIERKGAPGLVSAALVVSG